MVNCIIQGLKWGYKRTKKYDFFKQSISLTYKGNESISSWIGTFATLLIIGISLSYFVMFVKKMYEYSEVSWNQNTKVVDNDKNTLNFNFSDFKVGASWNLARGINDGEQTANNSMFLNAKYLAEGGFTRLEGCQDDDEIAPIYEDTEIYSKHFWMDFEAKQIQGFFDGNTGSATPKVLLLDFRPWKEFGEDTLNSECVAYEIQEDYLENSDVNIFFGNKLVDLENIGDPITEKTLLETIPYVWGERQVYLVRAKKNELYLEDSLFPIFFQSQSKFFYSFTIEKRPVNSDFMSGAYPYGSIAVYIMMDDTIIQYRRKVLSIFEVLGIVGGIFEILETFCGFFIGIISYFMIKNELNESLKYANDRYYKLQKAYRAIPTSNSVCQCQCQRQNQISEEQKQNSQYVQNPNEDFLKDVLHEKYLREKEKHGFEDFKEEMNWIDIVFAIKELKQQVNYLLSKDKDFVKASKDNPALKLSSEFLHQYTGEKI